MSANSRVRTFLVGTANLLAILAVAGFLSHEFLFNETFVSFNVTTNVAALVDPSGIHATNHHENAPVNPQENLQIDPDFFNSPRFKRRQARAGPLQVNGDRQLMMGMGRKSRKRDFRSKGKGKSELFVHDEPDCVPLFPTPAPTRSKGKGKGGMSMMMKRRVLESGKETEMERNLMGKSSKGSKGYYYYHSPAPVCISQSPYFFPSFQSRLSHTRLLSCCSYIRTVVLLPPAVPRHSSQLDSNGYWFDG